MAEDKLNIERVTISYKLLPRYIIELLFRIHGVLLVLPVSFLLGYISLEVIEFYGMWEKFITFTMFTLSVFSVAYIYLRQYFIFKKFYYFTDPNIKYRAEFWAGGVKISQDGANLTEYIWEDFIKCRETKTKLYLYFKYDRALIVCKQLFLEGNQKALNSLLKENIGKYKTYQK